MSPRKRKEEEFSLPPLSAVLAPQSVTPEVLPPVEEPKFYGADFAPIMQNFRKGGTLRERAEKRAGLKKGMRITGHVHTSAEAPSSLDVPLVILDVFHGRLKDIYDQHQLAFVLDGIFTLDQAINVLQNFSQKRITQATQIDYVCFTYQSLFNRLTENDQQKLLSLPIEQAIIDPTFHRLFFPSLCQAAVWQGANAYDWTKFLEEIGAIDHQNAEIWRNYRDPESQTTPAWKDINGYDTPELMQEVLDSYNPLSGGPNREYLFAILGEPKAISEYSSTRYVLVPCRGDENHPREHAYAIEDSAAGNQITAWISEQEAETIIMNSEKAGWDQAYSLDHNKIALCPQCD